MTKSITKVVTASTARSTLGAIIDQAAQGSPFVVTNRGTPSAVILGIPDFLKATGLTRDIALGLKQLDAGPNNLIVRPSKALRLEEEQAWQRGA